MTKPFSIAVEGRDILVYWGLDAVWRLTCPSQSQADDIRALGQVKVEHRAASKTNPEWLIVRWRRHYSALAGPDDYTHLTMRGNELRRLSAGDYRLPGR
jgi:hypothetical protein